MEEMETENRKKVKEAIEEGRKKVDELTLVYTKRIALKDEELAKANRALGDARQTIRDKDDAIEKIEMETRSIRSLLRKALGLAKGRVSKRLKSISPSKQNGQ